MILAQLLRAVLARLVGPELVDVDAQRAGVRAALEQEARRWPGPAEDLMDRPEEV